MENNEIMNNINEETIEVTEDMEYVEDSGLSTGLAMLIGAGIVGAGIGLYKLGKKAVAAYKAKKEKVNEKYITKPDGTIVDCEDYEVDK